MKALLIVDLQNDFMPGGALAVPKGNLIIPTINKLMKLPFDVKAASQDWHPANHASFAASHGRRAGDHIKLGSIDQILWPVHCVQNTYGAELVASFDRANLDCIIHKGTDQNIDSYSAFFDNQHLHSTGLEKILRDAAITEVYIVGLATDYCVKNTALDSAKLGFHTYVISDACRGVNLKPSDSDDAFEEMRQGGVVIINSHPLFTP